MFRSPLKPSSGGSMAILRYVTELESVDLHSLQRVSVCGRMLINSVARARVCVCVCGGGYIFGLEHTGTHPHTHTHRMN